MRVAFEAVQGLQALPLLLLGMEGNRRKPKQLQEGCHAPHC